MKNIILILATVAGVFLMSCNSDSLQKNFKSEKEKVTVAEASAMLKGNALLIDVREPDELVEQSYDVKNSINIPLDSIESKLNNIPKDRQVIVACRSGKRSAKAYEILQTKGFTNIANLEGGMNAWSEAGLPTKTGVTAKKACCANPNSKDCNPDGTCKTVKEEVATKACCANPNSKDCNPDGTCKKSAVIKDNTGVAPQNTTASTSANAKNHLEVYCFHGTRQCETCINLKSNTKATLNKYFAEQLKNGTIVFSVIDVDDAKNEKIAEKFQATGTALMINKVVNGKDNIVDWSDFAFDKANEQEKFIPELKTKIEAALK